MKSKYKYNVMYFLALRFVEMVLSYKQNGVLESGSVKYEVQSILDGLGVALAKDVCKLKYEQVAMLIINVSM